MLQKSYCYHCDRIMLIEREAYHADIASLQARIHSICNPGHEVGTLPVTAAMPKKQENSDYSKK